MSANRNLGLGREILTSGLPVTRAQPPGFAENYLFAGSGAGGERAAATYGLIRTAKLNGLNREAYLREVLSRVADHPINRIEEH